MSVWLQPNKVSKKALKDVKMLVGTVAALVKETVYKIN